MTEALGTDTSPPDPAADFLSRLRTFHLDCGAPSYRSLARTSQRLQESHPDTMHNRDLPRLSVTAISEVLNGKRANLPSTGWVVAFVLSCQHRAYETCVLMTDPGIDILPAWLEHLRKARAIANDPGSK